MLSTPNSLCLFRLDDFFFLLLQVQYFSVKMMEGIVATSYAAGDKFYIDPAKLLPLERFLPQPKYVLPFFIIWKYLFILSGLSGYRNDIHFQI